MSVSDKNGLIVRQKPNNNSNLEHARPSVFLMFLLETTSGTAVGTHFMQITVLKSSGTENTKI